jgi:ribosomal protein S18 acetylase RimI-like enzyme
MSDSIKIRLVQSSDLALIHKGIIEINWLDISSDQKQLMNQSEFERNVIDQFEKQFHSKPKDSFNIYVAELVSSKIPVGFVSVGEFNDPWLGKSGTPLGIIYDIWIDPRFRNQGIGNELMDYALSKITERGYAYSSLHVSASNKTAISLYKKKGFLDSRITMIKRN